MVLRMFKYVYSLYMVFSFGMAVAPQPSGMLVLIKAVIKDLSIMFMDSATCVMWHYSFEWLWASSNHCFLMPTFCGTYKWSWNCKVPFSCTTITGDFPRLRFCYIHWNSRSFPSSIEYPLLQRTVKISVNSWTWKWVLTTEHLVSHVILVEH